jgi:PmbA protein
MKEIEKAKEILSKFREFEIYGEEKQETSYELKENEISLLKNAEKGLAFRIINHGQVISFCVPCFPNWEKRLKDIVHDLKNWSTLVKEEDVSLPEGKTTIKSIKEKQRVDEKYLLNKVKCIKGIAEGVDKRIAVKQISSSMKVKKTFIWNNKGVDCRDEHVLYSAGGMVLAIDKDAQIGWSARNSISFDKIDAEEIGREMAVRAMEKLGAKTIDKGIYNIILSSRVMRGFLSFFSSTFKGDAVLKHRTVLENKMGTKIVSSLINIVDDGTMKDGVGTSLCDCEGTPTKKTELIERGVLKNFLQDSFTSKKLNYENTANALRKNYRQTLEISPTNIYIQGNTEEDIFSALNNGLYITEALGLHTANQITGDFSVGISGQIIKNGKRYRPFKGAIMADNIFTILNKVFAVSKKVEFLSAVGAPDIAIRDIPIGG